MNHVLDWLQAYHDGELPERQLHHVEEHLAQCESCRADLEALRAFSSLLKESGPAHGLMRSDRFVAQWNCALARSADGCTTNAETVTTISRLVKV